MCGRYSNDLPPDLAARTFRAKKNIGDWMPRYRVRIPTGSPKLRHAPWRSPRPCAGGGEISWKRAGNGAPYTKPQLLLPILPSARIPDAKAHRDRQWHMHHAPWPTPRIQRTETRAQQIQPRLLSMRLRESMSSRTCASPLPRMGATGGPSCVTCSRFPEAPARSPSPNIFITACGIRR